MWGGPETGGTEDVGKAGERGKRIELGCREEGQELGMGFGKWGGRGQARVGWEDLERGPIIKGICKQRENTGEKI